MGVHYAACCNPIPGDTVLGFILEGKGLMIHLRNCEELKKIKINDSKVLNVSWEKIDTKKLEFAAWINVTIRNKIGSLGILSSVIGESMSNIRNLKIVSRNNDFYIIDLEIDVKDTNHLSKIIGSLRASDIIEDVLRS